jgi:hypothetical protein
VTQICLVFAIEPGTPVTQPAIKQLYALSCSRSPNYQTFYFVLLFSLASTGLAGNFQFSCSDLILSRDFCSLWVWDLKFWRWWLWRILVHGTCRHAVRLTCRCFRTKLNTNVQHIPPQRRQNSTWLHGVTYRRKCTHVCRFRSHCYSAENHSCCGTVAAFFTRLYTSECHTLVDISSSEDGQIQWSDLPKNSNLCPTFGGKYHHHFYKGKGVSSHAMKAYGGVEV